MMTTIKKLSEQREKIVAKIVEEAKKIIKENDEGSLTLPLSMEEATSNFNFEIYNTNGWQVDYLPEKTPLIIEGKKCKVSGCGYYAAFDIEWGFDEEYWR